MAKLRKIGNAWYYDGRVNGKRVRISLGKDKEQAKTKYVEIEYKRSRNDLFRRERIPIDLFKKEFLEHVKARLSPKTLTNYSIALGHLTSYLKEKENIKTLDQVMMGMLDNFVSFRLKTKSRKNKGKTIARSTVKTDIKAIKSFFNRAVKLDYITHSPARQMKLLRTANSHPRFFAEEEVALIFADEEEQWVRHAYMGLFLMGVRIGEEVNLEWEDIDFEGRRIIVRPKEFWKPKGMEERIIPMHPELLKLFTNMPKISRWVFTKKNGGKLNIHSLESRFRKQLIRLGINNASLHTWRHTFASYLMMRSGNIRAIQKLLGHKSIRTTEIYLHLSDKHLYHTVSLLPSLNLGIVLGTPVILPGKGITQVVDNNMVGDTGFEPVTSTV